MKVLAEFIDRWKKEARSEKEDRDDVELWEQQKEEYLQTNPTYVLAVAEMEAEDVEHE